MADVTKSRSMAREALASADATSSTVVVDRAALEALVAVPDQPTANDLWKWLVIGLMLLCGVSLISLVWLIADGNDATEPELVLTTFTAILTGLLGLFIKSPQGG